MLTLSLLREDVAYNPETGLFIWLQSRSQRKAGTVAGCKHNAGYTVLWIRGRLYLAHRLAWFYIHGDWPEYIDHINGDRQDNRLANLRPCTKSQNAMNSPKIRKSTTGRRGVTLDKRDGRYSARIHVQGRCINLGRFGDAAEASDAYQKAAVLLFAEFLAPLPIASESK